MKRAISLAIVGALTCLLSTGTVAKAGDSTWAACVWQTDAEAADNWLKMDVPKWNDSSGSSNETLGLRLIAKCDATPADIAKPNRLPNWKAMRQQLVKARGKGAQASASTAEARLCNHYAVRGDDKILYLSEAVRVQGGTETVVHQNYFTRGEAGAVRVVDDRGRQVNFEFAGAPKADAPVRLPQVTMIASPASGYTAEKSCRVIGADGSLQ